MYSETQIRNIIFNIDGPFESSLDIIKLLEKENIDITHEEILNIISDLYEKGLIDRVPLDNGKMGYETVYSIQKKKEYAINGRYRKMIRIMINTMLLSETKSQIYNKLHNFGISDEELAEFEIYPEE